MVISEWIMTLFTNNGKYHQLVQRRMGLSYGYFLDFCGDDSLVGSSLDYGVGYSCNGVLLVGK